MWSLPAAPGALLRPVLTLLAAVSAAAVLAACASPAPAPARLHRASGAPARPSAQLTGPGVDYYLSLGDSLAQGVEPGLRGRSLNTAHGYPDQLAALLSKRDSNLELVKLGCSGETTTTMIKGRHCSYPAGSQLAEAVHFLRTHRGRVVLITLDIGANDPNSCFSAPVRSGIPPCVAGPRPATIANLTHILTTLRGATQGQVPVVGMSLYIPELPEWLHGQAGRRNARLSDQAGEEFNEALISAYQDAGDPVANVAGAFHSDDFSGRVWVKGQHRLGKMPGNVAAICSWTWICAKPPRGPNKHANSAGYGVIARALLAVSQPFVPSQGQPATTAAVGSGVRPRP